MHGIEGLDRAFRSRLARVAPEEGRRRWVYVANDQLTDRVGPLAEIPAQELGIVLVESAAKAARRPYHRRKLALVLANQRQFALEQARRGVAVRYLRTRGGVAGALAREARELGPLTVQEPAERELREELAPLVTQELLRVVPHAGWLTSAEDFGAGAGRGPTWRMDRFYRHVRKRTGILMEGEQPVGGRFSFDAENRRPWKGEPPAPEPPRFEPDAVTREVLDLVTTRFAHHPGTFDGATLPSTAEDALALWRWALEHCLPHFGPYEDAFSQRSRSLFHTRVSGLLHLQRLLPREVLDDALAADLPLASREGFVRQVLGWREFVRHVHRATDGFRRLAGEPVDVQPIPGDGGYARWAGGTWADAVRAAWGAEDAERAAAAPGSGGARPDRLGATTPLPATYWGAPSGLACLDHVVADVWSSGFTHHVPRLMVLANLATLLGVDPRELTDWFWVAFDDAYDWVVEPNVLGMGTFAAGDVMTTKPYVCGAAYLDRMGDLCRGCAFDPRRDCPVTSLYWDFLRRNQAALAQNPRVAMPLRSAARRTPDQQTRDAHVTRLLRSRLAEGAPLTPEDVRG